MFTYNPYYRSPFPDDYDPYSHSYSPYTRAQAQARSLAEERAKEQLRAHARARAAQKHLRDRYLIPEYEEDRSSSDDEYSSYGAGDYTPYGYAPGYGASKGLLPRERAYLEAKFLDEREKRREILRRKAMEEEAEHRRQALLNETRHQANQKSSPRRRTIPVRSPSPDPRPQHLPSPPHSREPSPLPCTPPFTSQAGTPSSLTSVPIEKQSDAATIIQRAYRSYRALRSVQSLQLKFEQLQANFKRPEVLDFQGPNGEIITVSTLRRPHDLPQIPPKLAYTSTNVALHGYVESLNRLLVALDSVESHGVKEIREKRKEVVRRVENEAADIEEWWRNIWESGVPDVDVMEVDETPEACALTTSAVEADSDAMNDTSYAYRHTPCQTPEYDTVASSQLPLDISPTPPAVPDLVAPSSASDSEDSEAEVAEGLVSSTSLEPTCDKSSKSDMLGPLASPQMLMAL